METRRVLLAVFLSFVILLGYQYYFVPQPPIQEGEPGRREQGTNGGEIGEESSGNAQRTVGALPEISAPTASPSSPPEAAIPRDAYKEIFVESSRYLANISELGGGLASFTLKHYKETIRYDSNLKELVKTERPVELPLYFSWGVEPARAESVLFKADRDSVRLEPGGKQTLTLTGRMASGVEIVRAYSFSDEDYVIEVAVEVINHTANSIQGAPYMTMTNRPFSPGEESTFLFAGPAVLHENGLKEIKKDDIKAEGLSFIGKIGWIAYEDTYFMCSIIPGEQAGDGGVNQHTAFFSPSGKDTVHSILAGRADIIKPGERETYKYSAYFGPKDLAELKRVGNNLDYIVNFGWWDFIAKPTLFLLNFLYQYVHNYGIAIILITVLIKLLFWPITQKGMKSMKTMQKLQPKMAKLREKHKDDKERLNQEMIRLYQTYKVNPLGGCLPMLIQIPVFFALYKVLLQTIELRHAPFMLWINDLSAPDRLHIGVDIPFLGGIPVLTLLMGASMYLQQKMSPAPADPAQAKVMMFLPVIFTFMFVNFASGLVLYWFVNNLLSIAQQYFINRAET